jgi:hypothetical protein
MDEIFKTHGEEVAVLPAMHSTTTPGALASESRAGDGSDMPLARQAARGHAPTLGASTP